MIKKSLLGVGLIVLLVAMTGIASADTFSLDCTDEHGETYIPADMRNVEVNVTGDTIIITYINKSSVLVDDKVGFKEISLNMEGPFASPTVDWPEKVYEPSFDPITDKAWAGGNWGPFNLNMSFAKADNRTAGPITLVFDEPVELECNDKGKVAAVHIISLNMLVDEGAGLDRPSVKVTNCGVCEEIPEFPTVALPIAAILGLSFIFMRRKE